MPTLNNTSEPVVPRKHFSNEQYFHYSLSFFSKVCKKLCNLDTKTIKFLENFLKRDTESGRNRKQDEPYIFTGEELYNALQRNKACSERCKQENYKNWNDLISSFNNLNKKS